jgi:8-oxo-dGTP pyrophosphatase MutT (NUDIX family)
MMPHSAAVEPEELAALRVYWGNGPEEHAALEVDDPFLTGNNQLLASNGRRAEICYVMHTGSPATGVLLHIKTFYPPGAFRLPTGGIHQGESVWDTLGREIFEETGLTVGTGDGQVEVQRFLGVLAYDLQHRSLGRIVPFATYHFLVRMPAGAQLAPQDADESIGGWLWRPASELWQVAAELERVHERSTGWGDWGRYRALSHRFVAHSLTRSLTGSPTIP